MIAVTFLILKTKEKVMVGTFWAFIPAIIAIILALVTKQV